MVFGNRYKSQEFKIADIDQWKERAKMWASHHTHFCYLNHNNYDLNFGTFPHLLAAGSSQIFIPSNGNTFSSLQDFSDTSKSAIFGYFGYDLKNEIESLESKNQDNLQFPDVVFFVPQHIIQFLPDGVIIYSEQRPEEIFEEIASYNKDSIKPITINGWNNDISKAEYQGLVEKIKLHIEDGDFYEINLCLEFIISNSIIDPYTYYNKLNQASPMPFSIFFGADENYILCASPERFLKKAGRQVLSQPIKGTSKRSKIESEDLSLKQMLLNSDKERSENMMIVDLVRNDLAKSCVPGSIQVDELFGVYSFPNIHQMISTISGTVKEGLQPTQVIENAFPMGSMTGAPKVRAMQMIDKFENSKRGAFSGAAGYILPNGDFDLNVLIRSIFYNEPKKTISFHVGSAITYDSVSDEEYHECMLKAKVMLEVLDKK
ncbi:MAG TPA: anthranilate synthase component I family protein [Cytophagaceae bacterium]